MSKIQTLGIQAEQPEDEIVSKRSQRKVTKSEAAKQEESMVEAHSFMSSVKASASLILIDEVQL